MRAAWSGGGSPMKQTGPSGRGYVLSTKAVDTLSDPNSTFPEHTFNNIGPMNLGYAHTPKYASLLAP
jgi:hypothetical protein